MKPRWERQPRDGYTGLHYIEFTGTERTLGTVTTNNVVFKDSAYGGHMYEIGVGLFTYIIGFFEGGLEIL